MSDITLTERRYGRRTHNGALAIRDRVRIRPHKAHDLGFVRRISGLLQILNRLRHNAEHQDSRKRNRANHSDITANRLSKRSNLGLDGEH